MKILKPHPEFYRKYKDRILEKDDNSIGVVVGYFIDTDDDIVLFVQKEIFDPYKYFNYFIKNYNVEVKDYHGDPSNIFFLVNKDDIDKNYAKLFLI